MPAITLLYIEVDGHGVSITKGEINTHSPKSATTQFTHSFAMFRHPL